MILLRDDPPLPTQMWVLAPQLWEDLLTEYGFRVEAIDLLPHPDEGATPRGTAGADDVVGSVHQRNRSPLPRP